MVAIPNRNRWLTAVLIAVCLTLGNFAPFGKLSSERHLFAKETPPEVMSGRFSAVVVTQFIDREVVQSWLPCGLELAEECPYEEHPVIVMFGIQRDLTRKKRIIITPRYGKEYREVFIAVPYLRFTRGSKSKPVYYFARVYLDSKPATNQGIRRYGWAKILTTIYAQGSTYRIAREKFGTIFKAKTDHHSSRPVDLENDSLEQIRSMLSQDMILRHEGVFKRYRFVFHFKRATMHAVSTDLRFREGFMPGVPSMSVAVPAIDEQEFGAFHFAGCFTKIAR